jgi:group I intron endonuclease
MNIIYLLKNTVNDKLYVGQTWVPLKERWNNGYGYLGSNKVNAAILKYGKDKFYYEVLTVCSTQEIADYWEVYFIKVFDSVKGGYNIAEGGKSVMLGRKHSDESKAKMSQSHKGNTAHLGKQHSAETKKKLSDATVTQIKERGHPSLGRKHSDDSRQKISEAMSGCLPNSGSFKIGQSDERHRNRMGKTWKVIGGKRVWSDK